MSSSTKKKTVVDDLVTSKIVGDDSGGACAWCKKDTKKLSHCSGCRMTVNCSKECQKAAWPSHKADCKQAKQSHNDFRARGLGQIHRLFQEWCLLAGNSGNLSAFVAISLGERLLHLPDDGVILLIVDLSYNFQTFLPVDGPQIVRTGQIGADSRLTETARMQREQTLETRGQRAFYSLVIWLKQETLIFNVMPRSSPRKHMVAHPFASFEDATDKCLRSIKLSSKKFNAEVRSNLYPNLSSQIDHIVVHSSASSNWSRFVSNALRIPCPQQSQNRTKSHVIMIEIVMGWAPGKIDGIEAFQVLPWAQAFKNYPALREDLQKCKEKVQMAPPITAAAADDNESMLVPCGFVTAHPCGVSHICWATIPASMHKTTSAPSSTCDKLARSAFEEIKETVEFPDIALPSSEVFLSVKNVCSYHCGCDIGDSWGELVMIE